MVHITVSEPIQKYTLCKKITQNTLHLYTVVTCTWSSLTSNTRYPDTHKTMDTLLICGWLQLSSALLSHNLESCLVKCEHCIAIDILIWRNQMPLCWVALTGTMGGGMLLVTPRHHQNNNLLTIRLLNILKFNQNTAMHPSWSLY